MFPAGRRSVWNIELPKGDTKKVWEDLVDAVRLNCWVDQLSNEFPFEILSCGFNILTTCSLIYTDL